MLTFPPDWTFLVQLISFFVLWLVLRRIAWEPMLRVLEERDQRTLGNRQLASQWRTEAEQARQRYEEAFARARAEITAKLQNQRSAIAQEEQGIVSAARSDAQTRINEAREQLHRELKAARESIVREAETVGRVIARQLLGREVA
ncbi:MAG: ATP synthase F0 subunit B [Candidatus Binatia bacterium]|nr:ATP synthase F0 subunit B [Candidatus Binatia bacterium]